MCLLQIRQQVCLSYLLKCLEHDVDDFASPVLIALVSQKRIYLKPRLGLIVSMYKAIVGTPFPLFYFLVVHGRAYAVLVVHGFRWLASIVYVTL